MVLAAGELPPWPPWAAAPVSLTTLVDSPLIAGDHYRQINVTPPGEPLTHVIDMVAESEADLAMTPQDEAGYRKLVAETGALFGARHYTQYHFLLTLSDEAGGGLHDA